MKIKIDTSNANIAMRSNSLYIPRGLIEPDYVLKTKSSKGSKLVKPLIVALSASLGTLNGVYKSEDYERTLILKAPKGKVLRRGLKAKLAAGDSNDTVKKLPNFINRIFSSISNFFKKIYFENFTTREIVKPNSPRAVSLRKGGIYYYSQPSKPGAPIRIFTGYIRAADSPKNEAVVRYRMFQKVIHPIDEKIYGGIEKISRSKKFTNFMRTSSAPLRHYEGKFYTSGPLMAKGALFLGGLALLGVSIFSFIKKRIENKKN